MKHSNELRQCTSCSKRVFSSYFSQQTYFCNRQVHISCDPRAANDYNYMCPPCTASPPQAQPTPSAPTPQPNSRRERRCSSNDSSDTDYEYTNATRAPRKAARKKTKAWTPTPATPRPQASRGKVGLFSSRRGGGAGAGGSSSYGRGKGARIERLMAGAAEDSTRQGQEDQEEYIHTIVIASADDEYFLSRDACVICGAVGGPDGGAMLSCSQCAQCYHNYCANVRLSTVLIQRGWRCLDCTVCEGCGGGHDEHNLLLCDECDVAYHTYCLKPALERIPSGPWRCRWCARCHMCEQTITTPVDKKRDNGNLDAFNLCAQCASMRCCGRCTASYVEGDLMIQCANCRQWLHAKCENMSTEQEVCDVKVALVIQYDAKSGGSGLRAQFSLLRLSTWRC